MGSCMGTEALPYSTESILSYHEAFNTPTQNVFIKIDPTWSYNIMGLLIDYYDVSVDEYIDAYEYMLDYLKWRYNFTFQYVSANEYNAAIKARLDRYSKYPSIESVDIYVESLFRNLMSVWVVLGVPMKSLHYHCNDNADIVGMVAVIYRH